MSTGLRLSKLMAILIGTAFAMPVFLIFTAFVAALITSPLGLEAPPSTPVAVVALFISLFTAFVIGCNTDV